MSSRQLVLLPALVLALGAHARDGSSGGPPAGGGRVASTSLSAAQSDQDSQQKRREVLREATKAQLEESPAASRQLSPREREDLRRLLRNQQQDWMK